MPRYFLNLRRGPGQLTVDPEGDELADFSLVRPHVLHVIREMMSTRTHAVRDWMACSFEVMDEDARLVMKIPFSDVASGSDHKSGR